MEFIKKEVNGDVIYLKEKKGRYRVVYPIKNEDGSFNWKNFICGGSWWNLVWIAVFIIVAVGAIVEYIVNVQVGLDCLAREEVMNNLTNMLGGMPI